jgi:hypothetical protein
VRRSRPPLRARDPATLQVLRWWVLPGPKQRICTDALAGYLLMQL